MIKTVCVDLDGVLAEYDGWRGHNHIGDPIPEGVELAKHLRERGFQVIIFSCRLNGQWFGEDYSASLRVVEGWLDKHSIPYDRVATQMDGKPFADVYIDDRAVQFHRGDLDILTKVLQTASTRWEAEV